MPENIGSIQSGYSKFTKGFRLASSYRFLRLCLLQILFCSSVVFPALAEESLTPPTETKPVSFFENENIWGRSFDVTSMRIVSYGVATSLVLSTQDRWARDNGGHHAVMDEKTAEIGDMLGTGIPGLLVALGQLQYDPVNGESHLKSWLGAGAWTYLLKTVVSRKRPGSSRNYQSWPSGHTSTMAMSATSLWLSYGWKVGLPVAALAAFTGASRIADDAHFLSDVAGGAMVGLWMGRAYHVTTKSSYSDETSSSINSSQYVIVPSFGNETVFLSLLFDF